MSTQHDEFTALGLEALDGVDGGDPEKARIHFNLPYLLQLRMAYASSIPSMKVCVSRNLLLIELLRPRHLPGSVFNWLL